MTLRSRASFLHFDTFLGQNFEVVPERLEGSEGEKLSIFSLNVRTVHINVIPGFWNVGILFPGKNEPEQFLQERKDLNYRYN